MQRLAHPLRALCFLLVLFLPAVPGWADQVVGAITVGNRPSAAAVNPLTNQIYVANESDGTVTVIDGASGATSTVSVAASPTALAVNAATDKVYVVNYATGTVTVINAGNGNSTASVTVGNSPFAVAVNPITNLIYVANEGDSTVTVIDGSTDTATATVALAAGSVPIALAVNTLTNQIYVANFGVSATASPAAVINGANNGVTTVNAGVESDAVAVNEASNTIYIANKLDGTVTVINGATMATTTVTVGSAPEALLVNPATNQVYVANAGAGTMTVIDGSSTATATITVGGSTAGPQALALNSASNKIYVVNAGSGGLAVVEGNNGAIASSSPLTTGAGPVAVAVNPATNRIYVVNSNDGTVTVVNGADNDTATVTVGTSPQAVAVNPVTNRIYVASNDGNAADSTVTMIDGATLNPTMIAVGGLPIAVALNPVTNRAYVASSATTSVTVIDGITNGATAVVVGSPTTAVAVNPLTDQIYLVSQSDNSVTVLDGATHNTATVSVGNAPVAVAVNPVTNQIYVANLNDNSVTVIDGATNQPTTFAVGVQPTAVAVNPVTNQIYVANAGDHTNPSTVTVIDGLTNATTPVAAGVFPNAVGVNPVTNQIYVANKNSNTVTVIDGATRGTTTVATGSQPSAVAVNPATNQIYLTNNGDSTVTVLDGATNMTTSVAVGTEPSGVAVSPVTGQVYSASSGGNTVTVITPVIAGPSGLATLFQPLPGNVASATTTAIDLAAASAYGAAPPPVQQIYFQFDTVTGPWLSAVNGGVAALPILPAGLHTLYAFATDGQESTSVNTGAGASPIPGQIAAYAFTSGFGAAAASSFFFQEASVTAENTAPSITLTVQRSSSAFATVDYQTVSGSAVAGVNFVATKGTLSFAQGVTSQTITVPLLGQDLVQSDAFFSVELSNPSGSNTIGSPGTLGIFILNAAAADLSVSNLNAAAPSAAPPAAGSITVTLSPPAANGQWRLFGELQWRASGATASGLLSGNYEVEFQPEAGYQQPDLLVVPVTAGENAAAAGTYVASGSVGAGSLTVTLAPVSTGGWRIVGSATYLASGATLANLNAGSYVVEFEPVIGLTTPSDQEAVIQPSQTTAITATYAVGDSITGAAPSLVDGFISTDPRLAPSVSYTGQIQTDEGFGSGFVPLDRVVVTAAHVIFDDAALAYASGIRWSFQNDTGLFEAPVQVPRGFYVLDGYAAQRAVDNSPGLSTAASQQLDAAALYFLEPAARGGQSGYLASNSATNPWLTNSSGTVSRDKFLAGYPVNGVDSATDGRLYATPIVQSALVSAGGSLFTTTALASYPGNAGGPVFVGYNDPVNGEIFFPAAIYLGGTATTTVRAIDGPLIDLMTRAEVTANGGPNNVGGGVIQVNAGITGNLQFALGSLDVILQPAGAAAAGARWSFSPTAPNRLSGDSALNLAPGSYQIVFNSVPGYTAPAAMSQSVTAGRATTALGVYTPLPAMITSRTTATAIMGEPFSFRVTASPEPTSFTTTSTLPAGLTLDPATGLLSGTPTQLGGFPLSLAASNSQGSAGASNLQLTVAMAGHLAVSVTGSGTVTKALAAPTVQAVGSTISITATPGRGAIFADWTITDPTTGAADVIWHHPTYVFEMPSVMNLQANFVPNPFPTLTGLYNGLLTGTVDAFSARGAAILSVTSTGAFTGSIYIGAQRYGAVGALDSTGAFAGLLTARGQPNVVLNLQLDLSGATGGITGQAIVNGATLVLGAYRTPFTAKSPAPQALGLKAGAKYTLALPHPTGAGLPQGDGYGTVTVSPLGAIRFAGVLGDGTAVSESSSLSPTGHWPFFLLLYSNGGALTGQLSIPSPATAPAISGSLDWFKPTGKTPYYPNQFTTSVTVLGSALGSAPLAGLTQETLTLGVGGLAQAVGPFTVHFDAHGNGTVAGVSAFSLKINPSTGLFTGKFPDAANKSHPINGVLLPTTLIGSPAGYGLFLGLGQQTGAVEF